MLFWAIICAASLQAPPLAPTASPDVSPPPAAASQEAPSNEGAKSWAPIVPSTVPARCRRRLEVTGFADNERAMAVTQHVRCPAVGGTTDAFEIIDLIELKGGTVLASYQGSPINRTHRNRRPLFVPPAALRAAYPLWARARPRHAWTQISRAGHFKVRKHDFKDVMVRVRLDDDSPMDVRAEGTQLQLSAPLGKPIGCMVVGRLVDGSEVDLGHVRDEAPARQTERGTIEVVFSAHGHLVALVHHGVAQDSLSITHTRKSDPIGSTQVGFLQMLKWDAESVKELYGELHPGGKDVWDEMVGAIE